MKSRHAFLEEIAAGFPEDSPQSVAIRNAAFALSFAILPENFESFIELVNSRGKELSEKQKENLRKMGIPIDGEEDNSEN